MMKGLRLSFYLKILPNLRVMQKRLVVRLEREVWKGHHFFWQVRVQVTVHARVHR